MVRTHTNLEEEGDEVDTDSDYEEEPITNPMNAQTGGSAQEGNIPGRKLLPGAFTTWVRANRKGANMGAHR